MSIFGICSECGKENVKLIQGSLCNECYAVEWDAGFESTTDWGAKIAHNEFISNLNEVFLKSGSAIEIITKIIASFEPSDWYCSECDYIFISKSDESSLSSNQIYSTLNYTCPVCGCKGTITRDYLGEK